MMPTRNPPVSCWIQQLFLVLFVSSSVLSFSVTTTSPSLQRVSTTLPNSALFAAAKEDDTVHTIQILMSDTGGGHRASANALRDALEVQFPQDNIQCDIVDIYTDYGPIYPYNDYVAWYKRMAANPWSWDLFYHFGATPFGIWLNDVLLDFFCFDAFSKCLDRPSCGTNQRADMVVSVHPLTQSLPLKILQSLDSGGNRDGERTTPFCTVVTDLGSAHPTWFNPGVDKCFVPSDALHRIARERGLEKDQIVQHGLPIRRGFWDTSSSSGASSSATLRRLLLPDVDLDVPVVLLVGGGDGMGGIVEIASGLEQALQGEKAHLVAVCGNNAAARDQLQSSAGSGMTVMGFVDNMDEWMMASDVLVTKAGPGTIAEASICGLPCMMFSYLPGQEAGNIPFVEQAGFGKYSPDPAVIASTVKSWLASPDTLRTMQDAARNAARPASTLDIARDIGEMLLSAKEGKGGSSADRREAVLVK